MRPTPHRPAAPRFAVVVLCCAAAAAPLAAQDAAPVSADERLQLGLGLQRRGLHEEASRELEAFLAAAPRHASAAEAWYRLGLARLELKKPAEAVAAFEKALQQGGGAFARRVDAGYRLGLALKAAGRPLDAAKRLDAAAREAGEGHALTAPAALAAGEAWRDAGKPAEAAAAFRRAADADGAPAGEYAVPALYAAGFLALDGGDPRRAAALFETAAQRAPAHPATAECRYLAGEARLRAGDAAGAIPFLEAAAKAGGEFADDAAFSLARACHATGRRDDAARAFAALAATDSPFALRAKLESARALHAAGKAAEAFAAATAAAADPKAPPDVASAASEVAAAAALDLGKADEAARLATRAAAGSDDPARAARLKLLLGDALSDLGRPAEALEAYRAATAASDPGVSGDAAYGEVVALHRLGRFDDALAAARRFTAERRDHRLAGEARYAEAESLFAAKRWAEADRAYAALPAKPAWSRPAAFKRAWCAWLAGDAAEAAKRFEALVAADGAADPVAEESLAMVAVARHAAGDADAALAAADRYRATHPKGAHLGKTERVASRVLKAKGDLRAAGERLAAAAGAGGASEADVAADRLTSAEIAYRQGDFRRAQSLYREAAERRDAVGAQACEGLAWCAFELGDDGDCEACVDAGLRHPAGESVAPSLRELLVSLRHRQGRFDDAAKAARDYLKRHATHARAAEVRLMLGTAQARADRPKDALRTLHELGRGEGLSRPDLLHYERAWAARKAGDEPSALADFAEVARLSKDDDLAGEARLHLGEAAAAAKETDEARAWFAQVKGRHAARAAYRDAFLRLEGGDVRGAAEVFERLATSSDPALSADAAFLAGDCRLRLSEWDAAARRLARFREAAPDHPNVATALRLQGRAELEAGRPARAIGPLEEFLRRDDGKAPSDAARAWLWLGRAKGETKDAAGAEAAYAKATTLSDGELGAEAQFRLGASRRDRGDLDGACDAWLKLAILYAHPEWASRGLLEAAKTYETQGRKDKAKTLYAEAAERFGATPAGEAARRRRAALGE